MGKIRRLSSADRRTPMHLLSPDELAKLRPAEVDSYPSPIPTQIVASEEFMPVPQRERPKKVEARLNDLADQYGRKNALNRRRLFKTAAGMSTAFVALTDIYAPPFRFDRPVAPPAEPPPQPARALSLP